MTISNSEQPDEDDRDLERARYLRKHHPTGWRRWLRAVRHRMEYGGFLLLRAVMRVLGPDRASRVSGALWRFIAPLTKRHKRALAHLAFAFPEKTPEQRDAIARRMWENLGRVTAEALVLERILAEPARIELDCDDAARAIRDAGGRGVIVSLHSGNWELASSAAVRHGFDVAAVYQRILNPLIDRAVVAMRAPLYPGGLHAKGASTARALMARVKSGHPVAFLADQRHARGPEVPFFGRPAPSNPFPAMVARRFQTPVIVTRAIRLDGAHFRIEAEVLPVVWSEDPDADILRVTAMIHARFEQWVREYPEQWMWAHRRWG